MSDASLPLVANVVSRNPDLAKAPPKGMHRADSGIWRTADGLYLVTTDMEPRYWRVVRRGDRSAGTRRSPDGPRRLGRDEGAHRRRDGNADARRMARHPRRRRHPICAGADDRRSARRSAQSRPRHGGRGRAAGRRHRAADRHVRSGSKASSRPAPQPRRPAPTPTKSCPGSASPTTRSTRSKEPSLDRAHS